MKIRGRLACFSFGPGLVFCASLFGGEDLPGLLLLIPAKENIILNCLWETKVCVILFVLFPSLHLALEGLLAAQVHLAIEVGGVDEAEELVDLQLKFKFD